jgi:serine O-acetyltransferase
LLDHAADADRRFELLLKKLEDAGVHVNGDLATADRFDPQYLSKIVD